MLTIKNLYNSALSPTYACATLNKQSFEPRAVNNVQLDWLAKDGKTGN